MNNFLIYIQVLQLENELMEMEMDRDKHSKVARNTREKLSELEKDRKELADEYVVLKTNYLNLQKAHEAEVRKILMLYSQDCSIFGV